MSFGFLMTTVTVVGGAEAAVGGETTIMTTAGGIMAKMIPSMGIVMEMGRHSTPMTTGGKVEGR